MNGWTAERATRARQADAATWQRICEEGGSEAERAHAWNQVQRSLDRERQIVRKEAEAN